MAVRPTIVVIAYNRESSLKRLLDSVSHGVYPDNNVTLVISIDKSENKAVEQTACAFNWPFGPKKIIIREQHLGLKAHVITCGDLSEEFGTVILLEDDLIVSPHFYCYATTAIQYYATDYLIAGVSLYSYHVTENGFRPFFPLEDSNDVHFIQLPSSWGQVFTKLQWGAFKEWFSKNGNRSLSNLPDYIRQWSQSSWKKHFVQYMIENNLFFVYPRISLSTNFSEPGVNSVQRGLFQVPLANTEHLWAFCPFSQSRSKYDSSFEPTPDTLKAFLPELTRYDFECDLYGTKNLENISHPYLISSKLCAKPTISFGNDLISASQNLLYRSTGSFYSLAPTQEFTNKTPELIDYYVSAKSIYPTLFHRLQQQESDKIAYEKTRDSWKQWCDDFLARFKLDIEFPYIEVLILANSSVQETTKTINSIHKQGYPSSQYHITVFTPQNKQDLYSGKNTSTKDSPSAEMLFRNFRDTMLNSKGQYFVIAKSGDVFFEKSFKEVNHIFRKYPDINWLTGIQTLRSATGFNVISGTTLTRRWNRHIFERNLYKNAGRSLSPASTFWKKYLWDIASPSVSLVSAKSFFDDLWLAFFKVQELYTCDVYLSTSSNYDPAKAPDSLNGSRYSLVETGLLNKLHEFLFLNNIPYFRAYYKSKNCLPPVVRYDHKSHSYFLSDY